MAMLTTRRRHRAVKFQELPDAIVLHDNLLPQLVPELRVLTITEKPNSPPKTSPAERKRQRSRETRAKTPVFHRAKGGSEIPSILQLLKNNRKHTKTPSNRRKKSTTSSSTKSQAPSHFSRHSKELPDLPELSSNQCKLFAKWNERRQQGNRPYTTQVDGIFDEDQADQELERMRTSNTAGSLSLRLPGISTPSQSTKEQYIEKWLHSDFSKSPYTMPGDRNSAGTRKLRSTRITSSQKVVTITPFPDPDNG